MTPGYLYYLADPRTPRHPRYVGSTTNPVERERSHRRVNAGNQPFCAWKRELAANGLRPLLVTIARFDDIADARLAEWRLIERWYRRGLADLNSGVEGATERFGLYCQQFHKRPA